MRMFQKCMFSIVTLIGLIEGFIISPYHCIIWSAATLAVWMINDALEALK